MNMNNKTIISALVVLVFAAALFLVVSHRKAEVGPEDPILKVDITGGECLTGACNGELVVKNDGTYVYKAGNKEYGGNYTEAQMTQLKKQIEFTNFGKVKSVPFTGTCPIAYDGQEFIYTFYTEGEIIDSCVVAIDQSTPLFVQISKLLTQVYDQVAK